MIEIVVRVWLALHVTDAEADGLRRTAPKHLTIETAREHIVAARVAGTRYDIEPEILLAIAWHESHYSASEVTKEPKGKYSCGVMTPIPKSGRCRAPDLLGGYMEGAEHLRTWYNVCGREKYGATWRCAMLGYAGGTLRHACPAGRKIIRVRTAKNGRTREVDLCAIPGVRRARANWIRREMRHADV